MNITTPIEVFSGQKVRVFDPDEPPNEWVEFTVVGVSENCVALHTPTGAKTWADLKDIFIAI